MDLRNQINKLDSGIEVNTNRLEHKIECLSSEVRYLSVIATLGTVGTIIAVIALVALAIVTA